METTAISECNVNRCPEALPAVDDALYAIGGKWKLRIIIALSGGSKRFNELQRHLDGISARVLSNELKDLEQNGFVRKRESGVYVEYQCTEYVESLRELTRVLHDWGTMHRKRIMRKEL